jgi:hypothetical protein
MRALKDISQAPAPPSPGSAKRPIRAQLCTATNAEARRTNLLAERAEFRNALARGEMVRIGEIDAKLSDRLAAIRALLLALPGQIACRIEAASDAEARVAIEAEVEAIVEELLAPLRKHPPSTAVG